MLSKAADLIAQLRTARVVPVIRTRDAATAQRCPTGGVSPDNFAAYLAAGAAFVGMGGGLVDENHIRAGNRAAIAAVAQSIRA